jgi:hypothetical protein
MVFGTHTSTRPRLGICERLPHISIRELEKRGMLTEGFPLYDKWVYSGRSSEKDSIDIRADYYRATISFTAFVLLNNVLNY